MAPEAPPERGRRLARSTAFFSVATGLSRVLGLVREVVAASYFGVSGAMSAFTIAFQVPNLMRALFADSALQGAFVPVFTELLERGERREAFRVASSLFLLICVILGSITIVFIVAAKPIMALVTPGFHDDPTLAHLTVSLSRILFPVVLLLALSGVVVGMLNSFEHFSVPALAPVAWNLVIVGSLVGLTPLLSGQDDIYAYAIGVLAGTVVQFALPLPWLRGRGGRFTLALDWRNPHVTRVLKLMLPVTIALGLINLSLLINSFFGTLVNDQAPAAIDKAFRIYQLPQGLFSISIATIVLGTVVGTIVMCVSQGAVLNRDLGGIEARRTVSEAVKMLIGAALLAGACYGAWYVLDAALGRSFGAQLLSVSAGIGAGVVVYAAAVWALGVP